ncbi:MAG: hypothetical protein ACRDA4_06945 [Filifactoraceae bacterium]
MKKINGKGKLKCILLLLVISVITFTSCDREDSSQGLDKTYYQVVDNYYSRNYTEEELDKINSDEKFIDNLISYNKDLKANKDLNFLEIGFMSIEVQGKWNKPKELANGYGEKDLTDQEIDFNGKKLTITPVNAIQISKEAQKFIGKNWFAEGDFAPSNKFPMILGSGFKEYYNVGDEINFLYLFEDCKGYVAGFIEEGESLELDESASKTDLKSTIIMPYFDELKKDNADFSKEFIVNYNQVRNNGYIFVSEKDDFNDKKKLVEDLAKKNNVDFIALRGY